MNTEQLIARLAQDVEPVRPLRAPSVRAALWLAGAGAYLGVLVMIMSPRDDLAARMGEWRFMVEQAAALLTVLTAAVVAFALTIPGTRRTIVWVPLAAAVLWLAAVGAGALRDIQLARPGALLFQTDWGCVGTVLAGAALPAVTMAVMLRRGMPLAPHAAAALGGLAAAVLGNLGACVFHPDSSNLIVLVWHAGTVLAVAALAGIAGAQVLRWPLHRVSAEPT